MVNMANKRGNKKMNATAETTKATPSNDIVVEIPVKSIVADDKFNARKHLDGSGKEGQKLSELADSIKKDGQLQPVLVEKRKDGRYNLVFGFRRFAAISLPKEKGGLGRETIQARVIEATDDVTKMYLNLAENVSRENLDTFDLATRCYELSQKHEQTGAKIGNRLGKSISYINNLIRVRRDLAPIILKLWEAESRPDYEKAKICTTNWLNKVSLLNHNEQELALKKERGEEVPGDTGASGTGDGTGSGSTTSTSVTRATMSALKKALAAAKSVLTETEKEDVGTKADKEKMEYLKGVIRTLEFAMGDKKEIIGVYQPATSDAPDGQN